MDAETRQALASRVYDSSKVNVVFEVGPKKLDHK